MPKSFIVAPLRSEHLDQALPVVQALRPSMTAAEWRGMASGFVRPELPDDPSATGIVACRTSGGHIRGLFCYALSVADQMRRLTVGPFIVAGLFDARATADGLIEAIEQLARSLNAPTIEVDAATCRASCTAPNLNLEDLFLSAGYRMEGRKLSKTLAKGASDGTIGHA